eukprot:TRINITY_DN944_c0_g1_i5.p1 TRINITY_DN944_c0_g1~~TRINITY_DN944_c0_g1_i5.p1  ORF type:complete len:414 (+),score=43.43 TRINITY_DN944_c0_g1_i5:919-2160(+)
MSIKIADVIRRYDGSEDISAWIGQAELAKELLSLESLHNVIPLFLDREAFAVYNQLPPEDKKDEGRIKEALLRAFCMDKFSAFEEFRKRNWRSGELVDVYLTELRRLAKIAGIEKDPETIRLAFVAGLPKEVSSLVKAIPNVSEMSISSLVVTARALISNYKTEVEKKYPLSAAAGRPLDINQEVVNSEALWDKKTAKVRTIRADQRTTPAQVARGMDDAMGARIGKRGQHQYVIMKEQLALRDENGEFSKQEVKEMREMWVKDCWDGLIEADTMLSIEHFMKACPPTASSRDLNDWIHRAYSNLAARKAINQIRSNVSPLDYLDLLSTSPYVSVSVPPSLTRDLKETIKLLTEISNTMDQYLRDFRAQMSDITSFAGELKSGQNDFLTSVENKSRQMVATMNKAIGAAQVKY